MLLLGVVKAPKNCSKRRNLCDKPSHENMTMKYCGSKPPFVLCKFPNAKRYGRKRTGKANKNIYALLCNTIYKVKKQTC